MRLCDITLEKLRDVLHLVNDLADDKTTLQEIVARVDKSFDHWSKLPGMGDADKIPSTMLFVAEEPRPTQEEIEHGLSLVSPAEIRSCNRHSNCDKADQAAKDKGYKDGADHCHDDCCEDCFGS